MGVSSIDAVDGSRVVILGIEHFVVACRPDLPMDHQDVVGDVKRERQRRLSIPRAGDRGVLMSMPSLLQVSAAGGQM